jgi:hypothetical protein
VKYIFVAGAPGSKWSSVVKNIYYSSDIDQSDYSDARTYYHDASGKRDLMHLGAYFDPGMEFDLPESMSVLTRKQSEEQFDAPFSGQGVRIIKSHIFSYEHNIDYLRAQWPDSPIVLVHRDDDACLGWWVKCGHFNITYPLYNKYYVDLKNMAEIIKRQNTGIVSATTHYSRTKSTPQTNLELCGVLGIAKPDNYIQHYQSNDIKVTVI